MQIYGNFTSRALFRRVRTGMAAALIRLSHPLRLWLNHPSSVAVRVAMTGVVYNGNGRGETGKGVLFYDHYSTEEHGRQRRKMGMEKVGLIIHQAG